MRTKVQNYNSINQHVQTTLISCSRSSNKKTTFFDNDACIWPLQYMINLTVFGLNIGSFIETSNQF